MAVGFPVKADYVTGDVLTANNMNDLSGTLNTIQSVEYAAGKNKIINGDFRINQRAFTSNTTTATYNFDRWFQQNSGTTGTLTITPQTFTLGAAPIAGYEGLTFVQAITAAGADTNTLAIFQQRIEDVRTFAGQTVTFSFFARAASGTPKIGLELSQNFGSGGSPSSAVNTPLGAVTISTSWARYSLSVAVPSISGKTLGTTVNTSFLSTNLWLSAGSSAATRASSIGLQNDTFQIWGVQVEAASTASEFQTATGTLQGELAACQRYYIRYSADSSNAFSTLASQAYTATTTSVYAIFPLPVELRTNTAAVETGGTVQYVDFSGGSGNTTLPIIGAAQQNPKLAFITWTVSGATAGRGAYLRANNSTTAYIGLSAEL